MEFTATLGNPLTSLCCGQSKWLPSAPSTISDWNRYALPVAEHNMCYLLGPDRDTARDVTAGWGVRAGPHPSMLT